MRRLLGPALLAAAFLLGPLATPSYSSCAGGSGPEGSPVIFVGTPQEERRGFTRFAVEEVWTGPDLADQVWVLSGQEQPPWPLSMFSAVGSSTDAELEEGVRYVVGASTGFGTNACQVSALGGAADALRPDRPRSPTSEGSTGADPPIGPWEIGGIVTGVLVAAGGLVLQLRRRRQGVTTARST